MWQIQYAIKKCVLSSYCIPDGRSPEGGHGSPLQYSCLGNPTDRGAWWATVHRVTKSQTRLKWLSTHTCTVTVVYPESDGKITRRLVYIEIYVVWIALQCNLIFMVVRFLSQTTDLGFLLVTLQDSIIHKTTVLPSLYHCVILWERAFREL